MSRIIFTICLTCLSSMFLRSSLLNAFETAPQISDREIVERLTRLEEGQKNIEKRLDDINNRFDERFDDVNQRFGGINQRFDDVNQRFDDVNQRFDDVNQRFDDVNKRFDDLRSEMNNRFNTLQWMFGLFITVSIVILGFVLRMQWQMQKRQTAMETSLETQKDEMAFIKGLIEKFLPPKGAL